MARRPAVRRSDRRAGRVVDAMDAVEGRRQRTTAAGLVAMQGLRQAVRQGDMVLARLDDAVLPAFHGTAVVGKRLAVARTGRVPAFDVAAAGCGVAFTYPADDAHSRDTVFVRTKLIF